MHNKQDTQLMLALAYPSSYPNSRRIRIPVLNKPLTNRGWDQLLFPATFFTIQAIGSTPSFSYSRLWVRELPTHTI